MLWHQRLGHPSVSYMKHLFLSMLSKSDESEFRCQTCTLAKSHNVSYQANLNKSCVPFSLVHFDVWGPALTQMVRVSSGLLLSSMTIQGWQGCIS